MTITRAMILAAGKGTRLRPITHRLPKPLVDIGGTSPLLRTLTLMESVGIREAAINLHVFADAIRCAVADLAPEIDVHFFHEPVLLETGGGIKQALSFLGREPFLVVNGDVVWLEEKYPLLRSLMDAFDPTRMDALLTLVPLAATKRFREQGGDFILGEDGRLSRAAPGAEMPYVYAGVNVMQAALLDGATEDRFTMLPFWLDAIKKGRLFGYVYNGPWADIGNMEGLAAGRSLMTDLLPRTA